MAEKFILIPSNPLNLGDFTLVLKSRRVLFMCAMVREGSFLPLVLKKVSLMSLMMDRAQDSSDGGCFS